MAHKNGPNGAPDTYLEAALAVPVPGDADYVPARYGTRPYGDYMGTFALDGVVVVRGQAVRHHITSTGIVLDLARQQFGSTEEQYWQNSAAAAAGAENSTGLY